MSEKLEVSPASLARLDASSAPTPSMKRARGRGASGIGGIGILILERSSRTSAHER